MHRFLGFVLALVLVGASTSPAEAVATESTLSSSFTRTKTWYSAPLNRCFTITLTGTIKATLYKNGRGRTLKNPRISDTHMNVKVTKESSCSTAANIAVLELRQYYYDRTCEYRPSLSGGASATGFSVGGSVTKICNTFQTGYRDSRYESQGQTFNQYASGAAVQWEGINESWTNYTGTSQTASYHDVCVTGEFELQAYLANNKDDLLKFTFAEICQGVTA